MVVRNAFLAGLLVVFMYLLYMYPLKDHPSPQTFRVDKDGPRKKLALLFIVSEEQDHLIDAAAVLATQVSMGLVSGVFQVDFVGLLAPNVSSTFRTMLLDVGVDRLLEGSFPTPGFHRYSDTKRQWIAEMGCCGMAEMLKLWAFNLEEYMWVLSVDLDVMFLRPHEDLFRAEERIQLQYVHEIAPVDHPHPCTGRQLTFQGGFIVMRPNATIYRHMVEVFDATEFAGSPLGWNNSTIGACWGGATVQGFLSYYTYAHISPGRSLRLDECVYDRKQSKTACKSKKLADVSSIHYTGAPKPWHCVIPQWDAFQVEVHRKWRELHRETARRLNVGPDSIGCNDKLKFISLASKLAHAV